MARYRLVQDAIAVFSTERSRLYIDRCEYDELRSLLSKLRSALTTDVISRREGWSEDRNLADQPSDNEGPDRHGQDQNAIIAEEGWLVHRLPDLDWEADSEDARGADMILEQFAKQNAKSSSSSGQRQEQESENYRKVEASNIAEEVNKKAKKHIRAIDVRGVINLQALKQGVEIRDVRPLGVVSATNAQSYR